MTIDGRTTVLRNHFHYDHALSWPPIRDVALVVRVLIAMRC